MVAGRLVRMFCEQRSKALYRLTAQFSRANLYDAAINLLGACRIVSFERAISVIDRHLNTDLLRAIGEIIGDNLSLT
ncbi:MAG TPA: hypothetical protein ENH00_07995 [Actinobacteria bacterium]|nr:hypothetical protein BMS3Bbin01_01195 [bacterium BMS3Bbin01]HDH26117.1 hypothetical protein [Actinomycetota bacterium]